MSRKRSRKIRRTKKKKQSLWWRLAKKTLWLSLILVAACALGLAALFAYLGRNLPDVSEIRNFRPPETTRIYSADGEVIGELFKERRTIIPLSKIPHHFVVATLAAEDADFYSHDGWDYPGIVRALLDALITGEPKSGASTITQQVAKLLFLQRERTVQYKVKQMILARRIEKELSKDEILEIYINYINYGHGRYGVQEAAQFYFGKDAEDLTLAEASLIAGVPQSPTRLSPKRHLQAAKRRQKFALDQMADKREDHWPDISLKDIEEARTTDVKLTSKGAREMLAPEAMALARRKLPALLPGRDLSKGGFKVYTTIESKAQKAARKSVQDHLRALDRRYLGKLPVKKSKSRRKLRTQRLAIGRTYLFEVVGYGDHGELELQSGESRCVANTDVVRYNPNQKTGKGFAEIGARLRASVQHFGKTEQLARCQLEIGPQAAVVMINARTRGVEALVGGYERTPGFDRATQARRAPGSTFKPLVYSLALRERRVTPATLILDAPNPNLALGWNPKNDEEGKYTGPVRVRHALAKSINTVSTRLVDMVGTHNKSGPESLVAYAKELGITSKLDPQPSLALGAAGVTPFEMAQAYAAFAAGGLYEDAYLIEKVEDRDGRVIYQHSQPQSRVVLSPAEAWLTTSLLQSVVAEGTGRRARQIGFEVAGKTGTSNRSRDAWFAGVTPRRSLVVWVGFDDNRSLGRRASGSRFALPIWIDTLKVVEKKDAMGFVRPPGLEETMIDPETGKLAYEGQENAMREFFLEGTVPTEMALPEGVARPEDAWMIQLGEGPERIDDPKRANTDSSQEISPP